MKMENKWISCSTKGNITLSSELTKLPKEFAKYAILHELLHILMPNQREAFKAILSTYMPNWEELHDKITRFKHK